MQFGKGKPDVLVDNYQTISKCNCRAILFGHATVPTLCVMMVSTWTKTYKVENVLFAQLLPLATLSAGYSYFPSSLNQQLGFLLAIKYA